MAGRSRRWTGVGMAMLVAAWCAAAGAAEVAGVKLPDRQSVGGTELVLNGAGLRTRAIFKVYVGSLYLPAKANTLQAVVAKGPRRIQMDMLRNVTADQLLGTLIDGINDNTTDAERAAVKPQIDQLVGVAKGFGDIKEGSIVTLDAVDGGTRLSLDGQAKATIPGEAFNEILTRIWLGDKPAQADLKRAMLGG